MNLNVQEKVKQYTHVVYLWTRDRTAGVKSIFCAPAGHVKGKVSATSLPELARFCCSFSEFVHRNTIHRTQNFVLAPSSHNAPNHNIIIIPTPRPPPPLPLSSSTTATRRPSRRSSMLPIPNVPGVVCCTSPPPSFAARRHLRRLMHVVDRHLPHRPTRKTCRRPPPSSADAQKSCRC